MVATYCTYPCSNCSVGEDWVIINKQAILSEINGTIFAPENFKQHHNIATQLLKKFYS